MKRVAGLLLVMAAVVSAATGIAPASAFPPFPVNMNLNQDFWSGWQAGMVTPIVLPDATMMDIWAYKAVVRQSEPPSHRVGPFFIINYNVGVDQAEEQAADYFWATSPTSCHNMDCASKKAFRSLAPKKANHPDLIGKGVTGVIKLTYKGARVIL